MKKYFVIITLFVTGSLYAQTFDIYTILDFSNMDESKKISHLESLGFSEIEADTFDGIADTSGQEVFGSTWANSDTSEMVLFVGAAVEFLWTHSKEYVVKSNNRIEKAVSLNLFLEKQLKAYKDSKNIKKIKNENGHIGYEGELSDWQYLLYMTSPGALIVY